MAVEPLTSTPFVCPSIGALEPVPLVGNRALNARQLAITSPAITAVPARSSTQPAVSVDRPGLGRLQDSIEITARDRRADSLGLGTSGRGQ